MTTESGGTARIEVRGAHHGDGEAVARFMDGLSVASRYQRFFTGNRSMSPAQLRRMVAVSPREFVLLALAGDAVVGHLMAVRTGEATVEVAIIVAEAYRQRGIGNRLVHELAGTLPVIGVTEVSCDVLSENRLVLNWLRRLLRDFRLARSGETVTVYGSLATSAGGP
jgi:L-amino acid N-acyltransferase YncA